MFLRASRKAYLSFFGLTVIIYTVLWQALFLSQYFWLDVFFQSGAAQLSNESRIPSGVAQPWATIPDRILTTRLPFLVTQQPSIERSSQSKASAQIPRVAIGVAVTSIGMRSAAVDRGPFKNLQFFSVLLQSFCDTASAGFEYHFYVAYDETDRFFIANRERVQRHFAGYLDRECDGVLVHRCIHFLMSRYSGRPAWSQNDVMMKAYLDGNDYFYRVNDDSKMVTSGWTEAYVDELNRRQPPNVGVVGPDHQGGNTKILTHDFVHKTHVEIFGLYYPRCYSDLYADTWISNVYGQTYTTKLQGVRLNHTQGLGKRYPTRKKPLCDKVNFIIRIDKAVFDRYLKYRTSTKRTDGARVIAMALHGNHARHTVGAIRNAQLAPIIFPGWRLRVYTAGRGGKSFSVPDPRIIDRLVELGAEIVYINTTATSVPHVQWPYAIVDDESVKYFIVRNPDARLSHTDFAAVTSWIYCGPSFHVLRDRAHMGYGSVTEGLWGAMNPALRRHLPSTMDEMLRTHTLTPKPKYGLLVKVLRSVKSDYLVHHGFSCDKDRFNCRRLPVHEYYRVGQLFDEVHRAIHPRWNSTNKH